MTCLQSFFVFAKLLLNLVDRTIKRREQLGSRMTRDEAVGAFRRGMNLDIHRLLVVLKINGHFDRSNPIEEPAELFGFFGDFLLSLIAEMSVSS